MQEPQYQNNCLMHIAVITFTYHVLYRIVYLDIQLKNITQVKIN